MRLRGGDYPEYVEPNLDGLSVDEQLAVLQKEMLDWATGRKVFLFSSSGPHTGSILEQELSSSCRMVMKYAAAIDGLTRIKESA